MAGFLAHATMVVHFIVLLYIGLGGFLAWRWPRTIFVHVFFALWGVEPRERYADFVRSRASRS